MQTTNRKRFSFAMMFSLIAMLSFCLVACNKDDDKSNDVVLEAFGPSPVALGGEITFIGQNLNKVTSIEFPMGYTVSSFQSQTNNKIVVVATKDTALAYEGLVTLHTSKGDIVTKTKIGYRQSAIVSGFSPATIKAGENLTIAGTYLSSIQSVIFNNEVEVKAEDFVEQKNATLLVKVPAEALSGEIIVFDGKDKIHVDGELKILAPAKMKVTSKGSVNGMYLDNEIVVVSGENLDVVKSLVFSEDIVVNEFVSQSATEIKFKIPFNVGKDMKFAAVTASGISVECESPLTTADPVLPFLFNWDGTAETNPTPDGMYQFGDSISVEGKNLDLIQSISVGGADAKFVISDDKKSVKIYIPNEAKSFQKDEGVFINDEAHNWTAIFGGAWADGFKVVVKSYNGNEHNIGYIPGGWPKLQALGFAENKSKTGFEAVLHIEPYKLENVKSVMIDDVDYTAEFKANYSGESTTITVPYANATSCNFVATLVNGVNLSADAAKVDGYEPPVNPIITNSISVEPGTPFELNGINFTSDCKLYLKDAKGNKVDGAITAAYVDANTILAKIAFGTRGGKYSLFIENAKGSGSKDIEVVAGAVTVWTGKQEVKGWANIDKGTFPEDIFKDVKVGNTIVFHVSYIDADNEGIFQFFTGKWGAFDGDEQFSANDQGNHCQLHFNSPDETVSIKVTATVMDKFINEHGGDGAFVLQGDNVMLTKITVE